MINFVTLYIINLLHSDCDNLLFELPREKTKNVFSEHV